jgi:hypothetical protein
MALEAKYSDDSIAQSMYIFIQRGHSIQKVLVYREGTTGKWLSTEGISFNGLERNPDNLIRSIGRSEPVTEIYVMPEK